MPTMYEKLRGHKECTLCSEIKPKKAYNKKDFELLQCSGAHKNMHCCNDCFKKWKTTRRRQDQQMTCPLCNGMSFDTHDILNTLLGSGYGRFGGIKRRFYTGPRGGRYYKTNKGSKVYIK